jgi:hypothetical protein
MALTAHLYFQHLALTAAFVKKKPEVVASRVALTALASLASLNRFLLKEQVETSVSGISVKEPGSFGIEQPRLSLHAV